MSIPVAQPLAQVSAQHGSNARVTDKCRLVLDLIARILNTPGGCVSLLPASHAGESGDVVIYTGIINAAGLVDIDDDDDPRAGVFRRRFDPGLC